LPRTLHLQAMPAMELRVASNFASFGASSGETPSCPAATVRLSRLSVRFRGRPGSCTFRPCRRWIFGSPRTPHPSAHPKLELRVAPQLRSSGAPADDSPGCPGFFIFRLCRRWSYESPRFSHPSAPLGLKLQVSLQLRSSSSASRCGCELPRILHLPALPWVEVSESPRIPAPLAPADGTSKFP